MAHETVDYTECDLIVYVGRVRIQVAKCENNQWYVGIFPIGMGTLLWSSRGWYDRMIALQAAISALSHDEVTLE